MFAVDDFIDEAVVFEELGGLEIGGEILVGGFFDDARASEADHGAGFGEDEIADGGEAGADATGGGVSEDGDVGEAGLGVEGEGSAGFRHLEEAEDAFIHAGASGGGDDDHGDSLLGGALDTAGEFFTDHRAHGGGDEMEIHDGDGEGLGVDGADSADHGVFEAGFFLVAFEANGVAGHAREFEGIDRGEAGVVFLERVGIEEHLDAIAGAEGEVMIALWADAEILDEIEIMDHLGAAGAFLPEAFGELAFFVGMKGGFGEDAHSEERERVSPWRW